MDSQNISSFLCRQQVYAQQQKQFFVRKPFGKLQEENEEDYNFIDDELPQKRVNLCLKSTDLEVPQPVFKSTPVAQAPSSVKSSVQSPSMKSFISSKTFNTCQYVVVLNDQQQLNLNQSLLKYDLTTIQMLELCDNKLKQIPEEIFVMSSLIRLQLDNNFIKRIPAQMYGSFQLEFLSLKNNLIQSLEPEPKVYTYVKSSLSLWSNCLRHLDISFNKFRYLDESIGSLLCLRQLLLNSNEFSMIPSSFGNLSALRQLGLDWFRYVNPPMNATQQSRSSIEKLQRSLGVIKQGVTFLQFIEIFSEKGISLDLKNSLGRNLVHLAALDQDLGALDSLLNIAPQLMDQIDNEHQTPLSLALLNESLFSSRMLILRGANVNKGHVTQGSLLSYTLENWLLPFTTMILKNGGTNSLALCDMNNNTPLHYLALAPQMDKSFHNELKQISQTMLKSAMDYPLCPNRKNKEGWAAIHLAIMKHKPWMVQQMVQLNMVYTFTKFDLEQKGGPADLSPIQLAALHEQVEVFKVLVDQVDILSEPVKLSKICRSNNKMFKIVQSFEREARYNFLRTTFEHDDHSNIKQLYTQFASPVKLMGSLEGKKIELEDFREEFSKNSVIKQERKPLRQLSSGSRKLSNIGQTLCRAPTPPKMNPIMIIQPSLPKSEISFDSHYTDRFIPINSKPQETMRHIFSFRNFIVQRHGLSQSQKQMLLQNFTSRIDQYLFLGDDQLDTKLTATLEIIIFKMFVQHKDLRTDLKPIIKSLKNCLENQTKQIFSSGATHNYTATNYAGNILIHQARNMRPTSLDDLDFMSGSCLNQYELIHSRGFYNAFARPQRTKK